MRWISAALMIAVFGHGALAQAPGDMASRASFCAGVIDKGLAISRSDRSDGSDAQTKQIVADLREGLTRDRERLRRFLLPYTTDQGPLTTAREEGARLEQECNSSMERGQTNSEACVRVTPCFDLDWLP